MDRSDNNTPRHSPYPAAKKPELLCLPVFVGFIHPFRLIVRPEDAPWDATLEQINRQTYDYVRLSRLAGGSEVGLPSPFHMVWGCDGALIIPALAQFRRPESALDFINRQLAALLLGGVYCEANRLEDLEAGQLLDWEFVRLSGSGTGPIAHFHNSARLLCMSGNEVISLLKPDTVEYSHVYSAHKEGREILLKIPNLTPEILLQGITGVVKRDWNAALANLWISIEQLTSQHWEKWVAQGQSASFAARTKQLGDTRTWTTALRQEILFQSGVFGRDVLECLFTARKARNGLVHSGRKPDRAVLQKTLAGLKGLMGPLNGGKNIGLFDIDLDARRVIKAGEISGPLSPTHWRSIPFLPRENTIRKRYRDHRNEDAIL